MPFKDLLKIYITQKVCLDLSDRCVWINVTHRLVSDSLQGVTQMEIKTSVICSRFPRLQTFLQGQRRQEGMLFIIVSSKTSSSKREQQLSSQFHMEMYIYNLCVCLFTFRYGILSGILFSDFRMNPKWTLAKPLLGSSTRTWAKRQPIRDGKNTFTHF